MSRSSRNATTTSSSKAPEARALLISQHVKSPKHDKYHGSGASVSSSGGVSSLGSPRDTILAPQTIKELNRVGQFSPSSVTAASTTAASSVSSARSSGAYARSQSPSASKGPPPQTPPQYLLADIFAKTQQASPPPTAKGLTRAQSPSSEKQHSEHHRRSRTQAPSKHGRDKYSNGSSPIAYSQQGSGSMSSVVTSNAPSMKSSSSQHALNNPVDLSVISTSHPRSVVPVMGITRPKAKSPTVGVTATTKSPMHVQMMPVHRQSSSIRRPVAAVDLAKPRIWNPAQERRVKDLMGNPNIPKVERVGGLVDELNHAANEALLMPTSSNPIDPSPVVALMKLLDKELQDQAKSKDRTMSPRSSKTRSTAASTPNIMYGLRNSPAAMKQVCNVAKASDPITGDGTQAPAPILYCIGQVAKRKAKIALNASDEDPARIGGGALNPIVANSQGDLNSGVADLLARVLADPTTPAAKDPQFCEDAFGVLSAGLGCPSPLRGQFVRKCLENPGIFDKCENCLSPRNPVGLRKAALEFGMLVAGDPEGQQYLQKNNPDLLKAIGGKPGDPVRLEVMMSVMRRKLRAPPKADEGDKIVVRDGDGEDPGGLLEGMGRVYKRPRKPETGGEDALKDILAEAKNAKDPNLANEATQLVCTYLTTKKAKDLLAIGGHEALLKIMKDNRMNTEIVGHCLRAFAEMQDEDESLRPWCASMVTPVVDPEVVLKDPECTENYIEFLEDLVAFPDEAIEVLPTKKVLRDLDVLEPAPFGDEMLLEERIDDIRRALGNEQSALTLKEVYGILMARQHNDETLIIEDDRMMRRLNNFIKRKMTEYGLNRVIDQGVESFVGSEYMYGCMCYQLLATIDENEEILIKKQVPQFLLHSMAMQTDEEIAQHAVLTAVELCEKPGLAAEFAQTPNGPEIIVSMLRRGRKATEEDLYDDVEDLVVPRVELIRKVAMKRTVFAETRVMEELIKTWNDYDGYWYGDLQVKSMNDLKAIFKKERRKKRFEKIGDALQGTTNNANPVNEPTKVLGRRASVMRRNSMAATAIADPASGVSPLERRKSVVINAVARTQGVPAVSPLERRKSVVPAASGARRHSLAGGGGIGGPTQPGLARRASAAFGLTTSNTESPEAMHRVPPSKGSPSMVDKQGGGLMRRVSVLIGKNDEVSAAAPGTFEKVKASQMQRRASMTPAGISAERETRKAKKVFGMSGERSNSEWSVGESDNDGDTKSYVSESSYQYSRNSSVSSFGNDPNEIFVPTMMEKVFKAMRAVVCDNFIPYLADQNVPMRLVGIVADRESSPAMLPDVLFLIGVLSGRPKIKDDFGDYHAIQRILDLLERAHKVDGPYVSEVCANGCLALANLCLIHRPNTVRFTTAKGTELTVEVLKARGSFNDSNGVNGASALICNLCFKNEDMKKLFGDKLGPAALVEAMANYHDTGDAAAGSRCISSLFKAIGNLALNNTNMEQFIKHKIDEAYRDFILRAGDELDDETMESCLRTLANLVIEKDNMDVFHSIVLPLLQLLRKEKGESSEIHRWAFMTIANLCRAPENAKLFVKHKGVETIVDLLPYIDSTPNLKCAVVYVLGIQTTYPNNIPILLNIGTMQILSDTLQSFRSLVAAQKAKEETQSETGQSTTTGGAVSAGKTDTARTPRGANITMIRADVKKRADDVDSSGISLAEQAELPIAALRCTHRLLKSKEAAQECVNRGVFKNAVEILKLDNPFPMLTYEAGRVVLQTMSLLAEQQSTLPENPVPPGKDYTIKTDIHPTMPLKRGYYQPQDLDPSRDKSNPPWKIGLPPQIEMNESPRFYDLLDFAEDCPIIIERLRECLANPRNAKNIRLQRIGIGLMTALAAERIGVSSLFRRTCLPLNEKGLVPFEEYEKEQRELDAKFEAQMIAYNQANRQAGGGLQRRKSIFQRDKEPTTQNNTVVSNQQPKPVEGFGKNRKPNPNAVVDIIKQAITGLWQDRDTIDECCHLLNLMIFYAYGHAEFAEAIADQELRQLLSKRVEVIQMMEKKRQAEAEEKPSLRSRLSMSPAAYKKQAAEKPEDKSEDMISTRNLHGLDLYNHTMKNYERFFYTEGRLSVAGGTGSLPTAETAEWEETLEEIENNDSGENLDKTVLTKAEKRVLSQSDLNSIRRLAINELPLTLTQCEVDPYPDGVMSLAPEMRAKLRAGGKAEVILGENSRMQFLWRASHDLVSLEWKLLSLDAKPEKEVDPTYPFGITIARIATIMPGLQTEVLKFAAANEKGVSEKSTGVIRGPVIEGYPKGLELCINFKDQKSRDWLLSSLAAWREASAFGFL